MLVLDLAVVRLQRDNQSPYSHRLKEQFSVLTLSGASRDFGFDHLGSLRQRRGREGRRFVGNAWGRSLGARFLHYRAQLHDSRLKAVCVK